MVANTTHSLNTIRERERKKERKKEREREREKMLMIKNNISYVFWG